ncbi:MAG: FadR/GntR family transcriptional regulator [Dermatophilus congolensis]|nr:FadR/GntR family transcriptional regulator [Dermatophilus congolensis]
MGSVKPDGGIEVGFSVADGAVATSARAVVPTVGRVMRAPKTGELIANHLRGQIVRGELKTGETLPPEVLLMEQFGVSRPTLREAFRILETEGLISVRRGARGGAQVMAPDLLVAERYTGLILQMRGTTLADVYEARTVNEPYCAMLLAQRRTDDDLAELDDCIAALEACIAADSDGIPDDSRWSQLSHRFHKAILERCGNQTLAVQGQVLAGIVTRHLTHSIARGLSADSASTFATMIKSYRKLVRLMRAQDAEGARAHWENHMRASAEFMLRDEPEDTPVIDLFY